MHQHVTPDAPAVQQQSPETLPDDGVGKDHRDSTWVPTPAEIAEAVAEIQAEWDEQTRRARCRWSRMPWTVPERKVSTTSQTDCPRGNAGLRRNLPRKEVA